MTGGTPNTPVRAWDSLLLQSVGECNIATDRTLVESLTRAFKSHKGVVTPVLPLLLSNLKQTSSWRTLRQILEEMLTSIAGPEEFDSHDSPLTMKELAVALLETSHVDDRSRLLALMARVGMPIPVVYRSLPVTEEEIFVRRSSSAASSAHSSLPVSLQCHLGELQLLLDEKVSTGDDPQFPMLLSVGAQGVVGKSTLLNQLFKLDAANGLALETGPACNSPLHASSIDLSPGVHLEPRPHVFDVHGDVASSVGMLQAVRALCAVCSVVLVHVQLDSFDAQTCALLDQGLLAVLEVCCTILLADDCFPLTLTFSSWFALLAASESVSVAGHRCVSQHHRSRRATPHAMRRRAPSRHRTTQQVPLRERQSAFKLVS